MNKLVRNIKKGSKYYNLEGLIVMDTNNSYYIIWFKLKDGKDKNVIYIKERPFIASIALKTSVKIITKDQLTIPNKNVVINMARVMATHWTGQKFRPKTLPEKWQKGNINNFYKDIDPRLLIYK
jgi:hypothetical protein